MMLADVLGVEYDDLVSISMSGRLGQISELFFSSSVLGSFPFQIFGITFENVIELFTASTQESRSTYQHVDGDFKSV